MKLFLSTLSSLLLFVESSHQFNITRGSSLSTYSSNNESNIDTYWLSPSGNIAFGFYPLCSNSCRFVVGIWFIKSAEKTLIWTANRNVPPFHHPSSINFNNDGEVILQTPDGKDKFLLDEMWKPASYAMMLDNGNFVLYGSNSRIIWESFDYPTDTILGGQKLKVGQSLISSVSRLKHWYGDYKLWVRQNDSKLMIHYSKNQESYESLYWGGRRTPTTLNLDSTGRLYIVNWDNLVLKKFSEGENHLQQQEECVRNVYGYVLYRATLESDGIFYLYKERIGCENEKPLLLWDSMMEYRRRAYLVQQRVELLGIFVYAFLVLVSILYACICWFCLHKRNKRMERARERENQKGTQKAWQNKGDGYPKGCLEEYKLLESE